MYENGVVTNGSNKMKSKKYHSVGTLLKSNRKIVDSIPFLNKATAKSGVSPQLKIAR